MDKLNITIIITVSITALPVVVKSTANGRMHNVTVINTRTHYINAIEFLVKCTITQSYTIMSS